MPSERVTSRVSSASWRYNNEYSVCTAAIGCTALARRTRSGDASDMPRNRTLPCSTNRFIDRNRWIDAVLEIQVDHVFVQTFQAGLAGLLHILRAAVHAVRLTRPLRLAEFRDQHDFVAPPLDGAADHGFVVTPAVHVGRVEVVHSEVDRVT